MNIPDDLEAPTGPLFVESRLDFSFDREYRPNILNNFGARPKTI